MTFDGSTPRAEHLERQARHVRLLGYGQPGVHRAHGAHVAVIGAGGLGCPALQALAAAGIGTLTIIDDDVVERSNLARQTLYRESDLGRLKVEAAADALRGLGPGTSIVPRRDHLDARNAVALIAEADVVVDTTDHWPTRFAVADVCRAERVPLVWGSVLSWDGLLTVFLPGEDRPALDDLVDREQQLAAEGPNCATAGVFAPLVAEIGAAMAGEALKIVTGSGTPLAGTVRSWNGRTGRVRELPLAASADAASAASATANPAEGTPPRAVREPGPDTALDPDLDSKLRFDLHDDELIVDVRPAEHPDLELRHRYTHLPLETIAEHVAHGRFDLLPLDEPLVVACAQGPRARYAAELLETAGAESVRTLAGGIPALAPLVSSGPAGRESHQKASRNTEEST